jgi:hypothetical protein
LLGSTAVTLVAATLVSVSAVAALSMVTPVVTPAPPRLTPTMVSVPLNVVPPVTMAVAPLPVRTTVDSDPPLAAVRARIRAG